jgi:hypothetical protein
MTATSPVQARSLTFGPRRPDGEFGTFSYNAARFAPSTVQFVIEMYGSEWATAPSCRLRVQNICRTAYWRAVADAQARTH